MSEQKFPRWTREKENCLFCRKSIDRHNIKISDFDNEPAILVQYVCENPECEYLHKHKSKYVYGLFHCGEGYVKMYQEFLKHGDPPIEKECKGAKEISP